MRRSAQLRDLSDDHHRALVLAKRAKTAAITCTNGDVDALWHAITHEWAAGLARHFDIEETFLLPPVRAAGGDALASRTERDHAAIRTYLSSGPFDDIGLRRFAQRLSDHIRFEERTLFPFAEAKLTQADLDRIAGAHRGLDRSN